MKALLLGGNGFIGVHLALALRARGHQVRILDMGRQRPELGDRSMEYVEASWSDETAVASAMEGVDVVFHLVSTTVPATAAADPAMDVNTNLVGSIRLFEQMIRQGRKRIVFLSSGGTVYGNPEVLPVPEDAPCNPISSYGIVKLAIERYLEQYRLRGALEPLVVRAANPYGPLQSAGRGQGVIATFARLALDRQPLPVWGDGSQVRDYLHISDLVQMIVSGVEAGASGTYNAGSGCGFSVLQIRDAISLVLGSNTEILREGGQSFGVDALVLDITKARRDLGWQPRVGLRSGLEDTIAWMRSGEFVARPVRDAIVF